MEAAMKTPIEEIHLSDRHPGSKNRKTVLIQIKLKWNEVFGFKKSIVQGILISAIHV